MNKILLLMCLLMSLACMMIAAVVLALNTQGMAIFTSVDPKFAAITLMVFAVVFLFLALRVAMKLKRK